MSEWTDSSMQREYPLASACQGNGRRDSESLDQFELRLTRYEHALTKARADVLREQLREAREALETADREASTAHDAIWHDSVQGFGNTGFGKLHDSDDPSSASSAIWRLHDVVRPTLTRLSEATPCDGSASCPAVAHVHGCFSEATP